VTRRESRRRARMHSRSAARDVASWSRQSFAHHKVGLPRDAGSGRTPQAAHGSGAIGDAHHTARLPGVVPSPGAAAATQAGLPHMRAARGSTRPSMQPTVHRTWRDLLGGRRYMQLLLPTYFRARHSRKDLAHICDQPSTTQQTLRMGRGIEPVPRMTQMMQQQNIVPTTMVKVVSRKGPWSPSMTRRSTTGGAGATPSSTTGTSATGTQPPPQASGLALGS